MHSPSVIAALLMLAVIEHTSTATGPTMAHPCFQAQDRHSLESTEHVCATAVFVALTSEDPALTLEMFESKLYARLRVTTKSVRYPTVRGALARIATKDPRWACKAIVDFYRSLLLEEAKEVL